MTLRISDGRRLQSPPGHTARPTAARVRLAVMNVLAAELPGSRWLDLCSGSGAMACEALLRGAAEVVAIERERRVAAVARANLEVVAGSLTRAGAAAKQRLIQGDALSWLRANAPLPVAGSDGGSSLQPRGRESLPAADPDQPLPQEPAPGRRLSGSRPGLRESPFDLIYLDPPWAAGLHAPLSLAVARGGWLQVGGTLIWEWPSDHAFEQPPGWRCRDARRYGSVAVLLLERDG